MKMIWPQKSAFQTNSMVFLCVCRRLARSARRPVLLAPVGNRHSRVGRVDCTGVRMRRMARILLLSWTMAALTGCTLSFNGPEVASLPEFDSAPVVRITAPLPNTTFLFGVAVNVQVQVSNAGPDIDRVEVS